MKYLFLLGLSVWSVHAWASDIPDTYWNHPDVGARIHGDTALERNLRPEACAQCHVTQFKAWKGSRHARAYSPGMVGQFASMGHAAGNDCLVCHAPLKHEAYANRKDLLASLSLLNQHPIGFDAKANMDAPAATLPLRHAGVTCAVCHIRDGKRFGPPRRGSDVVGQLNGAAHDGFIAKRGFESSSFCASCHQFPQSYAIQGKPLENTLHEWKQSQFAQQGVSCQSCHMMNREHLFRGVHDADMVRSGLTFSTMKHDKSITLSMASTHIGHAFPTYVTPKVDIHAKAFDAQGHVLQTWQWSLIREVYYDDGWKEKRDTRLQSGETRLFVADALHDDVVRVRFEVDVIPDYYYQGVYRSLLQDMNHKSDAQMLLKRALDDAKSNDYRLYEVTVQRR